LIRASQKYRGFSTLLILLEHKTAALPQIHKSDLSPPIPFLSNTPYIIIIMPERVIVVGAGLSGLSAAHTIYLNGGNVLLLDKNSESDVVYEELTIVY
jgi:hypothetical protein